MERRKAIFGQCFERGHDVHQNAADAILTKPLNRSKDAVVKTLSLEQTCSAMVKSRIFLETDNATHTQTILLVCLSLTFTDKGHATCNVKHCDGRGHQSKALEIVTVNQNCRCLPFGGARCASAACALTRRAERKKKKSRWSETETGDRSTGTSRLWRAVLRLDPSAWAPDRTSRLHAQLADCGDMQRPSSIDQLGVLVDVCGGGGASLSL